MIERFSPNSEYVFALQDAVNKVFRNATKLTEMYNKYRTYYDFKAEAKPLSVFSYCLLLNLKLMTLLVNPYQFGYPYIELKNF